MSYEHYFPQEPEEEEYNPRIKKHREERSDRSFCDECRKFFEAVQSPEVGLSKKELMKCSRHCREIGTKKRPDSPPGRYDMSFFEGDETTCELQTVKPPLRKPKRKRKQERRKVYSKKKRKVYSKKQPNPNTDFLIEGGKPLKTPYPFF